VTPVPAGSRAQLRSDGVLFPWSAGAAAPALRCPQLPPRSPWRLTFQGRVIQRREKAVAAATGTPRCFAHSLQRLVYLAIQRRAAAAGFSLGVLEPQLPPCGALGCRSDSRGD